MVVISRCVKMNLVDIGQKWPFKKGASKRNENVRLEVTELRLRLALTDEVIADWVPCMIDRTRFVLCSATALQTTPLFE